MPDPVAIALGGAPSDAGGYVREGRRIHVVPRRHATALEEAWSFGDEALVADVIVLWGTDGPALWIPRAELHSLLPDLHPMEEGWQLVVRGGRIFTAEWALREPVDRWRAWPCG